MKKIEVIELDYSELEDLVAKTYNVKKYSFVATEECSNDSDHKFVIDAIEPLSKWDQEILDKFISLDGIHEFSNYVLMQDLVNKGLLDPGTYLVSVCW